MFTNSQQSSFNGQAPTSGSAASGLSSTTRSSTTPRQGSPSYHPHLGTYGYGNQSNGYSHHQDYGSMYPTMDHAMAWSAYSGFYRGYEMATATTAFADTVWPHTAHHPFGSVSSSGHPDGVDPLDPIQLTSAASVQAEGFGSNLNHPSSEVMSNHRETESPEYKPSHFLNGSNNVQSDPMSDNPAARSGATRPSPDSGLTISDGVSSSGSPNQNLQSVQNLGSGVGMIGSPGSSPPPSSDLIGSNRPQPARSPYEWIKRPNFQNRSLSSSKEGDDWAISTLLGHFGPFWATMDNYWATLGHFWQLWTIIGQL